MPFVFLMFLIHISGQQNLYVKFWITGHLITGHISFQKAERKIDQSRETFGGKIHESDFSPLPTAM